MMIVALLLAGCRREEAPEPPETPFLEAEPTPVREGGAVVHGRVRLDGPRPAPRLRPVTIAREACGDDPKPDRSLLVGTNGSVAWAVVTLVQASAGTAVPAPAPRLVTVDHARCDFYPYVVVVPPGSRVRVTNSDSILHGVRRWDEEEAVTIRPDASVALTFPQEEKERLVCDLHYWSSAWVIATATPWHDVTTADGAFSIAGVPPGRWRLVAWHERFGEVEREIEVPEESGRVEGTLTFPSLAPAPAPTP